MSTLAPPPLRNAVLDSNGLITNQWSSWLTKLYLRVGQGDALTIDDLSALAAASDDEATSGRLAMLAADVDQMRGLILAYDEALPGKVQQLSRDIDDAKTLVWTQDSSGLLYLLNQIALLVGELQVLSAVREMNPKPVDESALFLTALS